MIILTGASGGIGQALIPHLTSIDDVIGLYHTTVPETPESPRLRYVRVDVERDGAIADFVSTHIINTPHITVVHAAVKKHDDLVVHYKLEDWDRALRVNLTANFLLTQALLPTMIRERWGRIIHFSSLGGTEGRPGTLAYATSKAGLLGLSNVLAKEYARFNITSNTLMLGHFDTGLYRSLPEIEKRRLIASIPAKKLGDVSNIAHAIAFLIQADYVNGATIHIDGGAP